MGCHHDHCDSVSAAGTAEEPTHRDESDLQKPCPQAAAMRALFTILTCFPPLPASLENPILYTSYILSSVGHVL